MLILDNVFFKDDEMYLITNNYVLKITIDCTKLKLNLNLNIWNKSNSKGTPQNTFVVCWLNVKSKNRTSNKYNVKDDQNIKEKIVRVKETGLRWVK